MKWTVYISLGRDGKGIQNDGQHLRKLGFQRPEGLKRPHIPRSFLAEANQPKGSIEHPLTYYWEDTVLASWNKILQGSSLW